MFPWRELAVLVYGYTLMYLEVSFTVHLTKLQLTKVPCHKNCVLLSHGRLAQLYFGRHIFHPGECASNLPQISLRWGCFSQNVHVVIEPVGISWQATEHWNPQGLQLTVTVDGVSLWTACVNSTFHHYRCEPAGRKLPVQASSSGSASFLCPVCKECIVFSDKDLEYRFLLGQQEPRQ